MNLEIEQLSPLEQRFEQLRRRLGLVLAPAVFLYVWWREFPSLSIEGHHLAAVMAAVVVLWITEALPMPVTALAGAAACVVLRVAPAKAVFAPFADPIMFLFIGPKSLTFKRLRSAPMLAGKPRCDRRGP